jgi:hypothetical protein
MTRYFEMSDDVHVPGRWHLSDPQDRNGRSLDWVFRKGTRVQVDEPIRVAFNEHAERGRPVDYSELSIESVPVVHARVAAALLELAPSDVQIFPVSIGGQPEQFCIVNVTRTVKCIDDERSEEVQYYAPDCEEVFRRKVGQYRSVIGMRIDPTKVGDAKVFRPWGWAVAIVVSEEIKDALERLGTVGVKFEEV